MPRIAVPITDQEPIVEHGRIDEQEQAHDESRDGPLEQDRVHFAGDPTRVQEEQRKGEDRHARAAQSHGHGAVLLCGVDVNAAALPAASPGFRRRVEGCPLSFQRSRNRRLVDKVAVGNGSCRERRSSQPSNNGMSHPHAVKNLDDVISEIEGRLDEKDEVRELTIKSSRTIARLSGSAIQAMHRGHDVGTALQETREEILKLRSLLKDHPDLYHTGIVENAMQEAGEAFLVHAILEQDPLPSPKDLGLTDTAYLLGLGDVVGELRRIALEHLRRGDVKQASGYLEKMERILDSLMRFDYPTALVALKRKQDVARSLIEKTRGEVAVASRSQELADKLDAVREKL